MVTHHHFPGVPLRENIDYWPLEDAGGGDKRGYGFQSESDRAGMLEEQLLLFYPLPQSPPSFCLCSLGFLQGSHLA